MTARAPDDQAEKAQLLDDDSLQQSVVEPSLQADGPTGAGRPRSQAVWVVAAAASISSSRYILISLNFHYPMVLLVWQLFATLLLIFVQILIRKRLSRQNGHGESGDRFPINLRAVVSLATAAAALPVSYQAILHFPNVASLVLFAVHALAVSELLRLVVLNIPSKLPTELRPPSKDVQKAFGLAVVAIVTCHIMLSSDYRLTSRGDRSLIVSSYLTALAQAALTFSSRRQRETKLSLDQFNLILASLTLLVASIWYWLHEGPYTTLQKPENWILWPNLLASAFAISRGGSVLIPLCEPQDSTSEDHTRFSNSLRHRLISSASMAGAVALASLLLPSRGFVNAFQLICYAIASAALFFGSSSASSTKSSVSAIIRLNGINKTITLIALLCWIAYIPLNFTDYPFGHTLPVAHPTIDHNYLTTRRFDIVVSRYHEDARLIANLVTRIAEVPAIRDLNPRVFVYCKGINTDIPRLRTSLEKAFMSFPQNKKKYYVPTSMFPKRRGFPVLEILAAQNYGREGATYMTHIARFYGGLAQHTLFTQASVHDLDDMLARLQYFEPGPPITPPSSDPKTKASGSSTWWKKVSSLKSGSGKKSKGDDSAFQTGRSTGMLPLGFTTEVCDCHKCSDTWGWHDTSPLIPQIFTSATGLTGNHCDKLLLTYKGQFIASAQRIRGLDRTTYVDLRDGLTRDDRWEHSKEYLEKYTGHGGVNVAEEGALVAGGASQRWGEKDSLERPWFGYTVERMWGVLMQCSDMGIAWKCPTLKSRWRGVWGGDKGDCQCFDMVRPPDAD